MFVCNKLIFKHSELEFALLMQKDVFLGEKSLKDLQVASKVPPPLTSTLDPAQTLC